MVIWGLTPVTPVKVIAMVYLYPRALSYLLWAGKTAPDRVLAA